MSEDKIFLTQSGYDNLKAELDNLKTVERVQVVKDIGEAKSYGDLSENSEYDAAKARESEIESKIFSIEHTLKNAIIIDEEAIDTSVVSVGCKVKVFDEEYDEEIEYKIVGASESDPAKGLISNLSVTGNALLGKRRDDVVKVMAPAGIITLKVLDITI